LIRPCWWNPCSVGSMFACFCFLAAAVSAIHPQESEPVNPDIKEAVVISPNSQENGWEFVAQSDTDSIVAKAEDAHTDSIAEFFWPDKVNLAWLNNPNAGADHPLKVIQRNKNKLLTSDSFSDHKLIVLPAVAPASGGGANGFQWVYWNGYSKPRDYEAVAAVFDVKWNADENIDKAGCVTAVRNLWNGSLKNRIKANLVAKVGKITGDIFMIDDVNALTTAWWAGEPPAPIVEAVNPRKSDLNALLALHKDVTVYKQTAAGRTFVANSIAAGYHMLNAWVALRDVEKAPLAILQSDGTTLLISEMNAGDYVCFNTHTVAHAGTDAECDIAWVWEDEGEVAPIAQTRVSVDVRFFVRFA